MRLWPVAALFFALAASICAPAARAADNWQTWQTSRVVQMRDTPVFTVDGKPFFVYAAAFFYERTPRSQWRSDLEAYKRLGINTIDLYVIWNWHEPREGVIDFDGSTNERRDLDRLLAMIHELGFKVILRPGPVIRNEWRNGGYPDYLLQHPEYAMPLHDILEGRYPATATLQNAHADTAADEWLHNTTHLREAAAWLRTVLIEAEPWAHDVLAIALDDDQGAYIDNDTWPAPHWHTYMDWLRASVQRTVGTRVPLFINTWQMKVTASAPVWAWGNWYQSDTYRIGDHDLSQLAFSVGLLQTQGDWPIMTSEFQAGWLQGADEIVPRPAAPENTTLALHEMLQLGVHGVVNFPVADTLNPTGWEAPWANALYSWDAAYALDGAANARFAPTAQFGALVSRYGAFLATAQPRADLAIAWLPSAYDPALLTNDRVAHLADLTIAAQARCRALALSCRFVDLRFAHQADLQRNRVLVIPQTGFPIPFDPSIERTLTDFRSRGGTTTDTVDSAVMHGVHSHVAGITDASLLIAPNGRSAIFDVMNPATTIRIIQALTLTLPSGAQYRLPTLQIQPGGSAQVGLNLPGDARRVDFLRVDSPTLPTSPAPTLRLSPQAALANVMFRPVPSGTAIAYTADIFQDGAPAIVLDNGTMRAIILPDAGARTFANGFTTIGGLRDDVETPPSPSPRDYIAPYTHPIRAGTFNRHYDCAILQTGAAAHVRCSYDAPDLASTPVHFEKIFALEPRSNVLTVDLRASADAVSVSAVDASLTPGWPATARHEDESRNGYRLETVHYPAGQTMHLTFAQGAPPSGANRPLSP